MIDLTAQASPPAPAPSYAAWESAGTRQAARMRRDLNDRTAGPMPSFGTMVHYTPMAEAGLTQSYHSKDTQDRAAPIAYDNTGAAEDGYSFGDVIDMINPLQHLPVIGMIYRKITGDTIKPISNIIGGTIFGGPVGAVSSTPKMRLHWPGSTSPLPPSKNQTSIMSMRRSQRWYPPIFRTRAKPISAQPQVRAISPPKILRLINGMLKI
jgi:hypothetical protein